MDAIDHATQLSSSRYSTRRKELLSLIQELRQFGAQTDLDLPRIAIIGNQSSGKSSVVEAISGIQVPRDAGTCTRCPMECRLVSSSSPWTCQISIRWEYDDKGKRLGRVDEIPFGRPIANPGDVELAIRRAQAAVLNPDSPSSFFVGMSEQELTDTSANNQKALSFSCNAICVDLSGPDLTDLSFIDLPGIIQNAHSKTVKLVQDLVVSHIEGNCLILVALPMTDDIENQKALQLARQVDPDGQRTIGVMTKPDLLGSGSTKSQELWLDVIEGRRHPLTHGYYCTRQPDDADRIKAITAARAREVEADYFAKTAPWATTTELSRLGTNNLVATLSKLLVEIIDHSLPKLLSETINQLEVCDQRIGALPPLVHVDPISHMSNLITSLIFEVNRHVHGGPGAERLVHDNRITFASYKKAIRRTAPNFVPAINAHEAAHINSPHEGEEIALTSQPFYLQDMKVHVQNSITRELPGKVPFEANIILIRAFQTTWERSINRCFDQVQEALLQTLRECVQNTFSSYEALQAHLKGFISEAIKRHRDLCFHHLSVVLETQRSPFTQNTHYLQASQDKWLAKYKDARAKKSTTPVPTRPEANSTSETGKVKPTSRFGPPTNENTGFKPISELTFNAVATQNDFKWAQGKGSFPKPVAETSLFQQEDDSALLAMLAARGFVGLTLEDLGRLNPPDEYEMELQMMAEVRGYFQISYKKMIDMIPELIDLTFVKAVAKDLQPYLYKKLGFGTEDASVRFAKFLAEDSQIAARRDTLMSQKTRLERVKQELYDFGL